jgi:hypothetical protein
MRGYCLLSDPRISKESRDFIPLNPLLWTTGTIGIMTIMTQGDPQSRAGSNETLITALGSVNVITILAKGPTMST